jgi:hypothetical protein
VRRRWAGKPLPDAGCLVSDTCSFADLVIVLMMFFMVISIV